MKQKFIIITVLVVLIGLGLGYILNKKSEPEPVTINNSPTEQSAVNSSPIMPTATSIPTPTWPPFAMKITIISDVFINVANDQRSDRISISKTKAFKRVNSKLIPIDISELKVGQAVTVDVKKAGQEIHLIIEQ